MPLPQQVIEQLGREPETSQGWATGTILFSGGIFLFVVILYCGIKFGYEPYVNSQVTQATNQIATASQSVSVSDEQQIVDFYSQSANLSTALANHVYVSTFLGWLEKNTEANVYYQSLDLSSGNRVSLRGIATTEADINQQIAIFEASSNVTSVVISNISAGQAGTGLEFDAMLTMAPSAFSSTLP
jgi:Tfp pilus assembly protein PilN